MSNNQQFFVKPRTSLLSSLIALALAGMVNAAPPTDSPYFTDPQHSYVEDQTSEGIGTVNMIVCLMSAMAPAKMVNKGDYIALVDQNKCDQQRRSSASNSGGSSEGAQVASYITAVVNSSRTSNDEPMRVKTWISEEQEGRGMTIFVNTSASAAPTSANPYGEFRLDFCGKPDGFTGGCMFNGFLEAQDGTLSFYELEDEGEGAGGYRALRLTSVGTSTGSGRLSMFNTEEGHSVEANFDFAFNQDYFLRGDQCFARDASDPDTRFSVWRYGLYDLNTGERINRNSGFPIEYTDDGRTYHGYLGYWGLHLPPQVELSTGATVYKVDYSSGESPTRTAYTVTKADGKLLKYTLRNKKLNELDKIKFHTFVSDVTGFFSGAMPHTTYEMYWDDAAGHFKVTGQIICGSNGCRTESFTEEKTVLASFFSSMGLSGWSQALGGELFIDLRGVTGAVNSATVDVNYRQQDLVYPHQMPAQLYCISNCPTADSMRAYFERQGSPPPTSPYGSTANRWNPVAADQIVTYTTDADAVVLRDADDAAVTFTDIEALNDDPQFRHGVRSGRLFTTLASVECSSGSGTYCDHKVNGLEVYYVWETGANSWNQFAAVKDDDGNFLTFEAPLQVSFNVPSGAQYGQYAGKSILLQYGGFGDLWGIPGHCVSRTTNQPVSCSEEDSRYVPEFMIPMNETQGIVRDGSITYLVKWLDREIRLAHKDSSACAGLTLPEGVSLPDASGLQDPSDPESNIYIGAKPTVTDAPRVIHGDVKY